MYYILPFFITNSLIQLFFKYLEDPDSEAIIKAKKLYQKEQEHVRKYMIDFEVLHCYFKNEINDCSCIEMFIKHV